jgi:hypothetical protein
MRPSRLVLVLAAVGLAAQVEAQEEEPQADEPDLSFLEYLGSWQESDEEWLIVADMEDALTDGDEADKDAGETDDTDEK